MSREELPITWEPRKYELNADQPEVLTVAGRHTNRDTHYLTGFTETPLHGGWWITAELRVGEQGLAVTKLSVAPHPAVHDGTSIRSRNDEETAAMSIDTNLMRLIQPAAIKRAFRTHQKGMANMLPESHPLRERFEQAGGTPDKRTGRRPSVMTPDNLVRFAEQLLAESEEPGFRDRLAEMWCVSPETAKYRIRELKKRKYIQGSGASMTAGPAIPRKDQHGSD